MGDLEEIFEKKGSVKTAPAGSSKRRKKRTQKKDKTKPVQPRDSNGKFVKSQ